jgi:hypothetical protein
MSAYAVTAFKREFNKNCGIYVKLLEVISFLMEVSSWLS